MRAGKGPVARKLLGFAKDFFAQTRARMALARERLELDADNEVARRQALVAEYTRAGTWAVEIELDMQVNDDAAGRPLPEPRWQENWELVGEQVPEDREEPGLAGN
ncbi:hypothetical protein [uncultured Maricaulis sp.]|uniref:hypothetical protein n=1 Tax=uncultured Maricaulis sp. TaxID=174710 RepID=UPI0030D6D159